MTPTELIVGPQAPLGNTYFDRIQVERGKFHGRNFPATPPPAGDTDEWWAFYNSHYYDLALTLYIAYKRTGDSEFLTLFRKVVDCWWQQPEINQGRQRFWLEGSMTPDPRHAGVIGLILRAAERPEMWDWINSYTRYHLNHWCKSRIGVTALFYGVRPGAFALHYAAILALALPDSFPLQAGGTVTNGAALRAQYLADCELVATKYFGELQQADGSWRWDDVDFIDTDGGQLRGVMQPFMVGLLLHALIAVHRVSTNEAVKTNIQNQITKACRHLYLDGPYTRQRVVSLNVDMRGLHYFYHGGTTVNRTRYVKGDYPANWDTTNPSDVQNARQQIATIIGAYGYAYHLTKDPFFKTAGDEMWDAAYGETDKIRNYVAGDPKSYNQNYRGAGLYLAYTGGVVTQPAPVPAPQPQPAPAPAPASPATPTPPPSTPMTPSPDNTRGTSIIDSTGATWTIGPQQETLRDGKHVNNGRGTEYAYVQGFVYVSGIPSGWYKWLTTGWMGMPSDWKPPAAAPQPAPSTPEPSIPAPTTTKYAYEFRDWNIATTAAAKTANLKLINDMGARGYKLVTVVGAAAFFEKTN